MLRNGETVTEGFQRVGQIALRHQHVADLVVGHRQIALPDRVAAVGLRQTLSDRALSDHEPVAERFQRLRQVALPDMYITETNVSPVVRPIISLRSQENAAEPRISLFQVSSLQLQPADPKETFQVVRVEFSSLLVGLQRALGIGKARDRAEIAESRGGVLA